MSESHDTSVQVLFDRRVVVPEHVATRRLDDELVLLNYDSETYFGLDDIGTQMWEVLCSASTIEAGVQQLLDQFDVAPDRLRADVAELIGRLIDGGLVELQPV